MFALLNNLRGNTMSAQPSCCANKVTCFTNVIVPMQYWFATITHDKGTAVWVVTAEVIEHAREIVCKKAQAMFGGLNWESVVTKLKTETNSVVGSHEVRFDNDNREV